MSFVADAHFQHILRVFNTNINGKEKVVFALAAIRGIGPRLACVICKKANIDTRRRAGELKPEEIDKVVAIMQNPAEFKIPVWMLNRQKDIKDGTNSQVLSNGLDSKFRDDLEMLKKMKNHRGLRHSWGLRVRGQHTKTTGRHGRTVGVSKKKNP